VKRQHIPLHQIDKVAVVDLLTLPDAQDLENLIQSIVFGLPQIKTEVTCPLGQIVAYSIHVGKFVHWNWARIWLKNLRFGGRRLRLEDQIVSDIVEDVFLAQVFIFTL
jgi:hypothetical protein